MALDITLPDGRTLGLGEDVASLLSCGVLVSTGIRVAPSSEIAVAAAELAERLQAVHAGKTPAEISALQEARRLYRSAGVDPTRTRPSSEALLRRVLKGQSLYAINNAVDACNLASLSFLLPIGLYDLDLVQGDVRLRLGGGEDEYPGIRKSVVHLAGRLGLFDEVGPFGSPTSDSARTAVSETTSRLLAVIMATAEYPRADLADHSALFADLLTRHCGGTTELQTVLSAEGSDP